MRRILFVDDDPYTLETLKKATQILGHQALLASTGQEARVSAVKRPSSPSSSPAGTVSEGWGLVASNFGFGVSP